MKTHLRRVFEVAVAVVAAAYSSAALSPTVTNFLHAHPADAGYVALVAGVVVAAYKAARDKLTAPAPATPPTLKGS